MLRPSWRWDGSVRYVVNDVLLRFMRARSSHGGVRWTEIGVRQHVAEIPVLEARPVTLCVSAPYHTRNAIALG